MEAAADGKRPMKLETYFPYRFAVAAEAFSRQLVEVYGGRYGLSREEWRMLALLAEEDEVSSVELKRRATLDKVQIRRCRVALNWGHPQFVWRNGSILARNNSGPARPYMARLRVFRRLI